MAVSSSNPYLLYIPNNTTDLQVPAWKSGDVGKAVKREQKPVRPTHLTGEAVHYLFPVTESDPEFARHRNVLVDATRSITHVGWGVDMVAADATVMTEEDAAKLPGERWRPSDGGSSTALRVPRDGTLAGLTAKHTAFLNRLSADGFKPVPPLPESAYRVVGYARPSDAAGRKWAAFRILSADPDDKNPSFDTARRCRDVAAWVRHATAGVCAGWPHGDTAAFVHGHDAGGKQLKGDGADDRFLYLPLPTINYALGRVESIRRVLVAAPPRCAAEVEWVRRRLPGQELVADGETKARGMLAELAASDWVLGRYTGTGKAWSTVTPVIWPGHDDNDPRKAEAVLRKAFVHAGLPEELVAGDKGVELEWRPVGFRAGLDLAGRYARPAQLTGRPYHVRVRFPVDVRGPLAVGAGRYRGIGVFALET